MLLLFVSTPMLYSELWGCTSKGSAADGIRILLIPSIERSQQRFAAVNVLTANKKLFAGF